MHSEKLNETHDIVSETVKMDSAAADRRMSTPANIFTIPQDHDNIAPKHRGSAAVDPGVSSTLDEDDDVDLFEEEKFMHRGLGASPRTSKKRLHGTESGDEVDEDAIASRERSGGDALSTPIAAHNPGYQLLLKLGWTAGKGLGATESGRVEPIPHYTHVGTTGLGQWQRDLEYMSLATTRPISLSERLATETEADREKREAKVQRDEATKAEVEAVKRALYRCDICSKQYNRQHELDSHLGSYEHHHAKRAREMREAERKLAKEGGAAEKEKKRAKRREEKEMEVMVKAATAAVPGGSVGVGPGAAAVHAAYPPTWAWPAAAAAPPPTAAAPMMSHQAQQHHFAAQYAAYTAQSYETQFTGYPPAAPGFAHPWPSHQHVVQLPQPLTQAPTMPAQRPLLPPAQSTRQIGIGHQPSVSASDQTTATSSSSAPVAAAGSGSTTALRPAISFGLGRKAKK